MVCICKICGREFEGYKKKTCSKECFSKSCSENMKKTHQIYPNMASDNMKKIHQDYPDMATRNLTQWQKNNPEKVSENSRKIGNEYGIKSLLKWQEDNPKLHSENGKKVGVSFGLENGRKVGIKYGLENGRKVGLKYGLENGRKLQEFYKDTGYRSNQEVEMAKYLTFNNINFIYEKTFGKGSGIGRRPDFTLEEYKLIIEVDGDRHLLSQEQIIRDKENTKYYESLGYTVLRVTNSEIDELVTRS